MKNVLMYLMNQKKKRILQTVMSMKPMKIYLNKKLLIKKQVDSSLNPNQEKWKFRKIKKSNKIKKIKKIKKCKKFKKKKKFKKIKKIKLMINL